jgi:FkbM family methyltransferase
VTLIRYGRALARRLLLGPAPVVRAEPPRVPRASLAGVLENLRRNGFAPGCVIDVGAARGHFTRQCAAVFPDASRLLFEPLRENEAELKALAEELGRARVVIAAAGERPGRRVLNVHDDLGGSSFLLEMEESEVNGIPREVPVTTIDAEIAANPMSGPFLIKADVQGAELIVLDGARTTLEQTEAVLLETTLFNTFEGGPILHEVVAYMADRGFCIHDLTEQLYRPLDGALIQVDVLFVRRTSASRRHNAYATAEQRREQLQRMREAAGA